MLRRGLAGLMADVETTPQNTPTLPDRNRGL